MPSEIKTTYTYGRATIRITIQYGDQNFEKLVEQVIIQKVLDELEQKDS